MIRPTITVSIVLALHLLLIIILRSQPVTLFLDPDESSPTLLYVLPNVVEQIDPLPPIPDPVMRAPMLREFESPRVEIPSSALDVMAVTIPSDEDSDSARNDERLKAEDAETINDERRCGHGNAAIETSIAKTHGSSDVSPCGSHLETGLGHR